ncbi:MAG: extensin family protein [Bradyrhizobium sp.]|uniref:extensin family protein n=1 Tax=Bradyrhizobium sp. TaxID=376 RepID=UPI001C29E157|nr:extensin family protein [Bradyrhizobium sp.]MBU6464120.1 extensin family protein [Pseudomonadota bacterium]MDE2068699.1 extensin family protein [Bradyrhizobium sp.]MDE2242073.1 extensin family protein [Bradyrhizobium sp.]
MTIIAAAAALLSIWASSGSAMAARRVNLLPWNGLFWESRPRLHSAKGRHSAKATLPMAVPLPRPRPSEAPAAEPEQPSAAGKLLPAPNKKPPEQAAAPAPQPPSACRQALTDQVAIAPSIADIHGPGGCGGEDLVRLEKVVLPDKRQVMVKPPAILRCAMASEVAAWVRTDVAPLITSLGSAISALDNLDSYECRGRNRVAGAQLSEHGRANALDVRGFQLANGQSISLVDRNVSREVRENVLHSVCARFTTVLGPGSDGYHEDHIHLDLIARHNNYRICQWNVWDPMPQIAPMLPAERPAEAPPREEAATSDASRPDTAKLGATRPAAAKSEATDAVANPVPPPIKKRR